MPRQILRILAFVAVLLMPAGMAAPAFAQPASVEAEHCGDHEQPVEDSTKAHVDCMACSALPVLQTAAPATALLPRAPRLIASAQPISGIILEIATPPPKLS